MRRYLPTLVGAAAATAVLLVVGNGPSSGLLPSLLVLPVAGLAAWWASRRGRAPEPAWGGQTAFVFVPAADRPPASAAAVAGALARVETRELLASGSFGVGLGFAGLVVVLFGFVWLEDVGGDLPRLVSLFAVFVHPLVGLTVLAAFRGRTRGRRDGAEELFSTCPTSESTRTLGHLGTSALAAIAALLTAGLLTFGVVSRSSVVFGGFGAREVANVVVVAVLAVGGVALGVTLARLVPSVLAPVVAVVAIGFVSVRLATGGGRATAPVRQLSTWLGDLEVDQRFTAPHWLAHLLWLVALTLVVAALALLRDDRRPAVLAVLGTGVLAAVASGWAATRPIDGDDAARIAALLADPAAAQRCVAEGPVSVCTFPGDEALRERYAEAVAPVVEALPPGIDPMTIRYAADVERHHLDPEVLALLPREVEEPGLLPLDMVGVPAAYEAARLWVGLGATGIAEDLQQAAPTAIRGQARGVLALWLATAGADDRTRAELTSFDPAPPPHDPGNRPWPNPCFAGSAPVVWAASDVAAARALSALPDDEVRTVVHERWSELVDPATSTDDLLQLLDLEPLGVSADRTRTSAC